LRRGWICELETRVVKQYLSPDWLSRKKNPVLAHHLYPAQLKGSGGRLCPDNVHPPALPRCCF
jgi:hypothetical protein